jgi:putative membrane protein
MRFASRSHQREEERNMTISRGRSIAALTAALAVTAVAQPRAAAAQPQNQDIVTAEAPRTNRSPAHVDFLLDALRTSLAEVRMGELAVQHSYDQKVRDYGTKLKSDHTAHATDLERMLEPLGVTIPTEPSAEALSQLAALERLSGEELDAAFIQMVIWTHEEAIEKYGAQTHANPDRALHDFASKSLPMLREHLAQAEALR